MSIARIARTVLEMTVSRSEIVHLPLPEDDPKRRRPVIDEARNRLGWFPRVPLEDGLRATIAYFADRIAPRVLAVSRTPTPLRRAPTGDRTSTRLYSSH